MIDYHHTVVMVWDVFWTVVAVVWVVMWIRWARNGFPLPDWVMER